MYLDVIVQREGYEKPSEIYRERVSDRRPAPAPAAPVRTSIPDDAYVARGWPVGVDSGTQHARRLLITRVSRPEDLNESRLDDAMQNESDLSRRSIVQYLNILAEQGVVSQTVADSAEEIRRDYAAYEGESDPILSPEKSGRFSPHQIVRHTGPTGEVAEVNFRGYTSGDRAVVILGGRQFSVPVSELSPLPAGPAAPAVDAAAIAAAFKQAAQSALADLD